MLIDVADVLSHSEVLHLQFLCLHHCYMLLESLRCHVVISVFLSVRDGVSATSMVCIDGFHQTFVSSASWDRDELLGSKGRTSRSPRKQVC